MSENGLRRLPRVAVGGVLVLALGSGMAMADERRLPDAPDKAEPAAPQNVTDLTAGLTPEDLVESLIGEGVTYDNVSFAGDRRGAGTATGFGATFGVDGGVLLSSGSVAGEDSNVIGPNQSDNMYTEFLRPGDADLDALVAPNPTLDATTLEFDFVADADQISFQYVFGSEEYNEYVGSEYDDVFAFFVNGQNCATVGTPPQRVSVNTVNAGLTGTEIGTNAQFFVNNPVLAPTHDTELDGFTRVLTCGAEVEPGATSHVKLSIADTSDRVLDSTVLIAAGTFSINHVPTADDQQLETPLETPVDITLTGSDSDGDPLTYALQSDPAHGELTGTAPDLTYTPEDGFTGPDEFTFAVSDGAAVSEPATVTIDVTAPPTDEPTSEPTGEPTDEPTGEPTGEPTDEPTGEPTGEPTSAPTDEPSPEPSGSPAPDSTPGDDDLPDTGSGLPLSFLGLALLAVAAGFALRARTP